MGQSSSVNSKTALPANNILIDASDSYVTDVKLRSSAIIPISEYIKRDKLSKNAHQRNKQNKKTFKLKETQTEEKSIIKNIDEKNKIEIVEKKHFLESSYEDIPDHRKWVTSTKSLLKQNIPTQKKQIPEKSKDINHSSVNDVHQLYKNDVYPYIYKSKYKKKSDNKQQEEKKIIEATAESDTYLNKRDINYRNRKQEESTHTLNKHHYEVNTLKNRKSKQSSFTIQTNIACIIHPEKGRYIYRIYSEENIRRPTSQKYSLSHKPDYRTKDDSASITNDHQKSNKFEKHDDEHKKYLSARQALENWKNIHTLKHYHKQTKPSSTYYTEEIYQSEKARSRAGYRELLKIDQKPESMSPLEISNYNYSKISHKHNSVHKVGERMQKYKHSKRIERPHSSHFEYIENNPYKQNQKPISDRNHRKYMFYDCPNTFDAREENIMEKEDFLADIERCLKNHHKKATIYGRQYSNNNKSTWVQDKHRRWHKVIIE